MPAPSLRRKLFPLLLAALVAVPAASSAAPRHKARQETRAAAAAPAPLALLERLWSALTSVWAEEGCRLDPNGLDVGRGRGAHLGPVLIHGGPWR